jgi:hypothetical protein
MPHNADRDDSASEIRVPSYRDRIQHWVIVRSLPNCRYTVVARFRNRSDAEDHLTFLRQRVAGVEFEIMFDAGQV